MLTIDPRANMIENASSSEQDKDPFEIDFENLLRGRDREHMSPYLYSTPDPSIERDPACGEIHYNNLIENVPEYYLYRDEVKILQDSAVQLAKHVPQGATIVEFGIGTEMAFRKKTLPFLKAIDGLRAYAPIDLCETYLIQARPILAQELPLVEFEGIATDFVKNAAIAGKFTNPVVFFKGSTITNVPPKQCIDFLNRLSSALPSEGLLIVGQDSNQDESSLRRAYINPPVENFVLSIFHRFNRDYPTPNFIPNAFRYQFEWLPESYCVKHSAVATQPQRFELNGTPIEIKPDDEFHIVSSYKYPIDFFQEMAQKAGFQPAAVFAKDANPMAIHVLQKP